MTKIDLLMTKFGQTILWNNKMKWYEAKSVNTDMKYQSG